MGLLTPRNGGQRSTIRERALRARTRGPAGGSGFRLAVAIGLLVGLIPAAALLIASARAAPPPAEPVRVAAVRTVVTRTAVPSPVKRATPRPTPTPWPMDLWARMVTVPTPEPVGDQAEAEALPAASATPLATAARPPATSTPEPEIVTPAEIASIQEAAQAEVAQEAVRPTPVSAAVQTTRLGSAVPDSVRRWESLILAASDRYKVDPNLIAALMMTESGGHENALSSAGAIGLMQIIDGPWDPTENIRLGTAILADNLRRYGGRVDLALAGYNAGNGAVAKYGGIPPYRETRDHVFRVLLRYELYRAG